MGRVGMMESLYFKPCVGQENWVQDSGGLRFITNSKSRLGTNYKMVNAPNKIFIASILFHDNGTDNAGNDNGCSRVQCATQFVKI